MATAEWNRKSQPSSMKLSFFIEQLEGKTQSTIESLIETHEMLSSIIAYTYQRSCRENEKKTNTARWWPRKRGRTVGSNDFYWKIDTRCARINKATANIVQRQSERVDVEVPSHLPSANDQRARHWNVYQSMAAIDQWIVQQRSPFYCQKSIDIFNVDVCYRDLPLFSPFQIHQ